MKLLPTTLTLTLLVFALAPMAGSEPVNEFANEIELDRLSTRTLNNTTSSAGPLDPDIEGVFTSAVHWLLGVNSNGESFGGGLFKGVDFFGSNIASTAYVPVEIRFSTHADTTTLCQTFRRDLGYSAAGVGTFPGAAYDMSDPANPRRLNICFVEDANVGVANLQWAPIFSTTGGREYVYVMASDYDGTGATYASFNGRFGAPTMDIYYTIWGKLGFGNSVLQTLPATFTITPYYVTALRAIPNGNTFILTWNYNGSAANFKVYWGAVSPPPDLFATLSGDQRQVISPVIDAPLTYYYRVEAVTATDSVIGTSQIISAVPEVVANNMTLLDFWNGRPGGSYGDIWGYVDANTQREYALICVRNEGVSIVDIDQSPPVEVGFIPSISPNNDAKDVKIWGHFAIVVKEFEAIQVVNISDVTNPVEISQIMPDNNGAHNCLVYNSHLYVIGNHGDGGLEIFDLSDPALPVEVGQFQPFYYHDIAIRNDTLAAAGINGDGVDLLDVSDPTNPFRIGSFNYTGSGSHNVEFSSDGLTLFTGDEIGTAGTWTRAWDITDFNNITKLSDIIVDASAIVHNSYFKNGLLYIAHYTEGVRVWDVSNPATPSEVGYYDTFPGPGGGFGGAWTVYPFLPSGRLIVSDFNTGLYVLSLDESPSCCLGTTGNIDNDPADIADIADLTFLIDNLFINFTPIPCPEEGNIDGDQDGVVDIADLTFLIDNLFINFTPTSACQ